MDNNERKRWEEAWPFLGLALFSYLWLNLAEMNSHQILDDRGRWLIAAFIGVNIIVAGCRYRNINPLSPLTAPLSEIAGRLRRRIHF